MFKKKPTVKSLSPLRSSDRRKLADQVIKDYGLDSKLVATTDEQTPEQKAEALAMQTNLRKSLFPDNLQSARFTTTYGPDLKPTSGTYYVGSHDGEEPRVLWFQMEGIVYPTVYTLWSNPDIVPLLHTPGIVVKKLQGGADLMTPGLFGGPPFPEKAKKGAVVAIASLENPSVPVAVGACEIDVSALQNVRGAKGHAVKNLHWAGDEMWGFSTDNKPGRKAPEEIAGWLKVLEARGLVESLSGLSLDDPDEDGGVSLGDDTTPEDAGPAAPEDDIPDFTQPEIDEAFRKSFLFGIHQHKSSNSPPNYGLVFPLSQSYVMSTLIQPFLPAHTPQQAQQLQIKKTSWKNIKKFIKSLDKEGLLKSKEKGQETVVTEVKFENPAIVDFKPYRLPKKETAGGTSLGRGETATSKVDVGDDAVGQKLKIVSYFKPTSKLQPIFDSASKPLFTQSEVRDAVTAYIEGENLVSETNKRIVKLNPILANGVFTGSGAADKDALAKGAVARDALIDRVLSGMSTSYAIVRNGIDPSSVKTRSGSPPKIHITLETRSGNKTVTKVSGLEPYHISPKPLADELRKVCAGSTSVEPLAGGAKKTEAQVMEIMVQGPQQAAVVKALEKRGVEKRWMDLVDKTKGKKR
ncbi:Translation machinery-associated protein 64 [Colletotrichum fructicola]|nr:Translation machinery-associated protein 64 [Colletotrichum fructicola]KAF4937093.1 Translation machinery-associated protein 64 [Colletotrichum fructicola]KAF5488132.1 Translation machinery-associated protein 64 [Colletotrichum fructicola]